MNLSTTYLGLQLANPFMPGASPLVDDLDNVKRLEDAGASAIVMHSLFEEQLKGEQLANIYVMEAFSDAYAEALSYFPRAEEFKLTPDAYLQHLQAIKKAVKVPVPMPWRSTSITCRPTRKKPARPPKSGCWKSRRPSSGRSPSRLP